MNINTYVPIAHVTLATSQTSVVFSGLPTSDALGNYSDLILVMNPSVLDGGTNRYAQIFFNGDTTGANYVNQAVMSNGTSQGASTFTGAILPHYYSDLSGNQNYNLVTLDIMSFSKSSIHKTVLSRSGRGDFGTTATVSTWKNTAPITSITISINASSFETGNTFSLYALHG